MVGAVGNFKAMQMNWGYCMGGSKGKKMIHLPGSVYNLADFDFWWGEGGVREGRGRGGAGGGC